MTTAPITRGTGASTDPHAPAPLRAPLSLTETYIERELGDHAVRRHHRSPALAIQPAGQDPVRARRPHRCRNSDALLAAESQSFLDNAIAELRPF